MSFLTRFPPLEGQERRERITIEMLRGELAPPNWESRRDPFVEGWKEMCAAYQPGDELWAVVSEARTWKSLGGRGGFEHVRNGAVVGRMLCVMS